MARWSVAMTAATQIVDKHKDTFLIENIVNKTGQIITNLQSIFNIVYFKI